MTTAIKSKKETQEIEVEVKQRPEVKMDNQVDSKVVFAKPKVKEKKSESKPGKESLNKSEGDQDTKTETNAALGIAEKFKFGTHCAITVAERSIFRLMDVYKNIFVLDQNMNAKYFKDQGFNSYSAGNYEKSIDFFQVSIEKGLKHDIEVLFYLGLAYINLEEYKKGLVYLKKAENLDRNDVDILLEIGQCQMKLEAFPQAIDYFKKTVLLAPDIVSNFYMLGTAYEKDNQLDKAVELYKKAIDLDPRDPLHYHALGFVYETQDKHSDAIICFRRAMEMEKER